MLLVDVREAEAEAVGEDCSAPPGLAACGGSEDPVGGVANGLGAGVGGFGAAEVTQGVDELRRIDVLLRLGPPPGPTRFRGDWGGGIRVKFPTLA